MLFFADFIIDPQRVELRRSGGDVIKIRPKPFDMLVFFADNAGRVVAKQELMERFWPGVHVGEDSLFQCIREIRTALGDGRRQILRNISGRGYLFEVDVTREEDVLPVTPPTVESGQAISLPDECAPVEVAETNMPQGEVVVSEPLQRRSPERRWQMVAAAVAAICIVVIGGLAVAVPYFNRGAVLARSRPAVALLPVTTTNGDPDARAMAAGVTERLGAGLARIENIRVVTPAQVTAHASLDPSSRPLLANYVVNAELQKEERGWLVRARMIDSASGEIAWTSDINVASGDADVGLQQSRMAAAIGHPLALRINAILNDAVPGVKGASGSAKVAVEQATASIVQTSRERFRAAQGMLEKALADNPNDVDVQAALAALQLRGIQMVWYEPYERESARQNAQAMMERVLRVKPTYVPVLESYCRLLSATNRFVDSLVACARTLSFDPWNGLAIYHAGLGQVFLGRFEDALTNFKLADQYDTPTVSRWTWMLGAGFALICLERYDEAVPWLERSLAVTQGSGRTHFMSAVAYQQLGRHADAQAMVARGLALRAGATAENIAPPTENTSPVYLAAEARIFDVLVDAGLPRR